MVSRTCGSTYDRVGKAYEFCSMVRIIRDDPSKS